MKILNGGNKKSKLIKKSNFKNMADQLETTDGKLNFSVYVDENGKIMGMRDDTMQTPPC